MRASHAPRRPGSGAGLGAARHGVSIVAVCVALAACGIDPASRPTAAEGKSLDGQLSPPAAYERRLREQVASATREAHWADAAIDLELLSVLRPDIADYREQLAEVQHLIDAGVAARLPRAAQAARRGDVDGATQLYLSVLALQPLNETAAEALRALEREHNKRNHLGKSSRTTLTRRANAEAEMAAGAVAPSMPVPAVATTRTSPSP